MKFIFISSVLSQNVDRVDTGPSVLKCRPVTVTFRHFKDREDILKASRFLKITEDYVYITEDVSKSTRESQQELRKFLNLVRKTKPGVKASLRYDRLIIDGEVFFYNVEKKSVELIRKILMIAFLYSLVNLTLEVMMVKNDL